jgi:hypothetical protein
MELLLVERQQADLTDLRAAEAVEPDRRPPLLLTVALDRAVCQGSVAPGGLVQPTRSVPRALLSGRRGDRRQVRSVDVREIRRAIGASRTTT